MVAAPSCVWSCHTLRMTSTAEYTTIWGRGRRHGACVRVMEPCSLSIADLEDDVAVVRGTAGRRLAQRQHAERLPAARGRQHGRQRGGLQGAEQVHLHHPLASITQESARVSCQVAVRTSAWARETRLQSEQEPPQRFFTAVPHARQPPLESHGPQRRASGQEPPRRQRHGQHLPARAQRAEVTSRLDRSMKWPHGCQVRLLVSMALMSRLAVSTHHGQDLPARARGA